MAQIYNSQLDAFDLYHRTQETESLSFLGGPALPALGHAIAGSTGAAISNVITYPLDLIITRLQIQRQLRKNSSTPHEHEYKSVQDAAEKIYSQEGGFAAFYTGVLQDTSKTIADSFLFFLAYNFLRQSRLRSQKYSSTHLPVIDELAVGFFAGAFSKFLTTPIANVVTRKQTASMLAARDSEHTQVESQSAKAIAERIRAEKGFKGFWSGYSASLVLTLNPSLTFFFFETFKRLLLPRTQRSNPPPQATFLLAAISKAFASSITYPFSLAKSRAQISSSITDDNDDEVKETIEKFTDGTTGATQRSRKAGRTTVFSIILHIAQKEGVEALYEGLRGELLKAFFSHGITMIIKQAVHRMIVQLYYSILKLLKRFPTPRGAMEATKAQTSQSLEFLKSELYATQEKGQSLAQQGSAYASGAYASSKSAVQTTGASVQNSMNATATQVSDAVGEAYNTVRDAGAKSWESANETAQTTASSAKSSASVTADKISDAAGASYKNVLAIGGRTINATSSAAVATKSTAVATAGQACSATRSAYDAGATSLDSARNTAVSAAHSANAKIQSGAAAASGDISDIAGGAYDEAAEMGGRASESINRTAEPVAEYVGRKTEELGRSIRPSKGEGK